MAWQDQVMNHLWEPLQLTQHGKADASRDDAGAPRLDQSSGWDFAAIHSTGTSSEHASK